jgi:tRNA A-37 threonylcarbamoyl transferase component Bud32
MGSNSSKNKQLSNLIRKVRPNWPTLRNFIGKGAYGAVYGTNNGRVMKISSGNTSNEFKSLRALQGLHFVPRVKNGNIVFFNENNGKVLKGLIRGAGEGQPSAFIMNRVGGATGMTLRRYLKKYPNANMNRLSNRIVNMVKTLGVKGYSHENLHEENIIVTADSLGRITGMWLIDFGRARKLAQRQVNELSSVLLENMLGRKLPAFGPEVMRRRQSIAKNLKLLPNKQNLKRLGRSRTVN